MNSQIQVMLRFQDPSVYDAFFYQIYVAAVPPASAAVIHLSWQLMLKDCRLEPSFKTTKTFFPSALWNATVWKLPTKSLAMRTEPDGTNLDT